MTGNVKHAFGVIAAFLFVAGVSWGAELVRSDHYIPVKEPVAATADSHYLVTTWLLSQGALRAEQKAALQKGQQRAEQLMLKKWADSKLKPFVFVNYSDQRRDLFILERVIQADAPPGKSVADAVAALKQPPTIRVDLNACYGFKWVRNLKSASFSAWLKKPENQRAPQWVADRIGSAQRILQGKLDFQYRTALGTVFGFEKDIDGGATPAAKAAAAFRKYLFLKDTVSQFSGDHRLRIDNMIPLAASQTVELGLARFQNVTFTDSAELERLITLFRGTVDPWKADPALKPIVAQRQKEVEAIGSALESGRGRLWTEEFAGLTDEYHFMEMYRQLSLRMGALKDMAPGARASLRAALWEAYDAALPEAAYYWETMCQAEIKNGSRAGLAYLITEQLSMLASIHERYKQPIGHGAEDARDAAARLKQLYGSYCANRNAYRIVIDLPSPGANLLKQKLDTAVTQATWLPPVRFADRATGESVRQWIVFMDGKKMAVRNGTSAPQQLPADSDAAVARLINLMSAYPSTLAKQAQEATDPQVALNFYGYLHAILDHVKSDDTSENGKQLQALKTQTAGAIQASFGNWLEQRRQADLVTRAEEEAENTADPDDALFD